MHLSETCHTVLYDWHESFNFSINTFSLVNFVFVCPLSSVTDISTNMYLLIAIWCCLLNIIDGQLYGLMLNNPISIGPIHHESSENMPPFHLHISSSSDKSSINIDNMKNKTELIRCRQDSDCIDDNSSDTDDLMYCDRHYGFCDYFREIGDLCRHDSQCDSGLICMFGKCARPFKAGFRGARCTNASDCNVGLCCARQHGERICKPKLKLGYQCFVPMGGLDYSLNESCPCDDGLDCQPVKAKSKRFVYINLKVITILIKQIIALYLYRKRNFKMDNVMRCIAWNKSDDVTTNNSE